MKTIGDRILHLRNEAKLSQGALGKMIGASHVTIGHWERGTNEPNGTNLYKMAIALNSTVEFIVTGNNDKPTTIDRQLLVQSIKEIEEAAIALNRDICPEIKATFITARYALGDNPSFTEILDIFND